MGLNFLSRIVSQATRTSLGVAGFPAVVQHTRRVSRAVLGLLRVLAVFCVGWCAFMSPL